MRINTTSVLAALISAALATGCANPKSADPQKIPPPPKSAPEVPKARPVALSPQLRAQAKSVLASAGQSRDPVLRANAVEGMQRSLGTAYRAEIVAALEDESPLVRFSAEMACGYLKLDEAKPTILKLVKDTSPHGRIGAIYVLHRLGDTTHSHELERMAKDPSPSVRADTAMILGRLGEPSALKILHVMQTDRENPVLLAVAEAMWRLHDQDGLTVLIAGTVSAHPDDQIVCLLALAGPRDDRVIEHIRGQLVNDYPEVGLVAARALGELGSDEGYTIAVRGTRSTDARQRSLAAFALGAIGRSDAQITLMPLLRDRDPNVRLAGAVAILQLRAPGSDQRVSRAVFD
ncbi:MAG: HEAT repeat domain-containing protein [Tepidisphaeraceae bacterium]